VLFILILEVILVVALGIVVLAEEKALNNAYKLWLGVRKQIVYRTPLLLVVRQEEQSKARHRYIHP
jgi:hypothetical protein